MVESGPRVERGQAYVIVRHVKFGPSKKGGGGKASNVVANAKQKAQNGTTSPTSPAARSSSPREEEIDPEVDFESSKETTWSVVDGNNDFDEVFDLKDDANGLPQILLPRK